MSGIQTSRMTNPFEIKRYNAQKQGVMSTMADSRALWEAYPRMKNYSYLDPSVRRVADWSKEGLLTKGASLFSVFEGTEKVVYDNADHIRHKLYIEESDLRGTVMKTDYEPGQQLGKGGFEFSLWLDVEHFGARNLALLDSAQYAPLLIRESRPDGHLWEYKCVIVGGEGYIDASEIAVGDSVTQIGSARGEAAEQRGPVTIMARDNSYIEFNTPKTSFGWEFTVTDAAWKRMQEKNQFYALLPKEGTPYREYDSMITASLVDFKFLAATDRQIDYWLTYGVSAGKMGNLHMDGLTNKHMSLGPGLYEWMKYSHTEFFNPNSISLDWLGNIMSQRWHNNVQPSERVVDFGTGALGLKWFQRACKEMGLSSSLEDFEIDNERAGGGFDGMHNGVIINKKQYVGTFLPEFGLIRVHYLPHLDDDKFEKRKYRGFSIRSGDFIALDTGYGDGRDANVYIVKDDSTNGFGYGIGLMSPFGPTFRNARLANRWPTTEGSKNVYKLIRDEAFTIVVKDPAAIMWLRPAIK